MSQVVLAYDPSPRTRAQRASGLMDHTVSVREHCRWLTLYVAGEAADFPSPSPFPLWGPRPVALVDLDTDAATVSQLVQALTADGYQAHAWTSDRTIPVDHGDNAHGPARDWPDGRPSPGPVTLNLLRRPRSLDVQEWLHRWHTIMGPVSGAIQPRTRYVRHHLGQALTADAPPWDGIAMESWPSVRHVRSPKRFYGADGVWALIRNQLAILRAVQACFWVWQVHTEPMTEIFLVTE